MLFAGDLEAAGERTLLANAPPAMLAATVLKAPHHGSRTSSSAAFIAVVRPQVADSFARLPQSFQFPRAEVVKRNVAAGAHVFRTDRSGAVSVDVGKLPLVVHTFNPEVKD